MKQKFSIFEFFYFIRIFGYEFRKIQLFKLDEKKNKQNSTAKENMSQNQQFRLNFWHTHATKEQIKKERQHIFLISSYSFSFNVHFHWDSRRVLVCWKKKKNIFRNVSCINYIEDDEIETKQKHNKKSFNLKLFSSTFNSNKSWIKFYCVFFCSLLIK